MNASIKTTSVIAKSILIGACVAAMLAGCKTAEPVVNGDLKNEAEIYAVKGRQGLQVGQSLSFGGFKTDKIKRGWTFSYSLPFLVKFSGANEKISFTQFDGGGRQADVALVSRFRETELLQLETYFSISLQYKNYCAGSVKTNNGSESWDFLVHQVDGPSRSLKSNSTAGFIRNGGERLEITGIRELDGSSAMLTQNEVYGYEFRRQGQVIAAVSTVNNGKVWFKKGIDDEMRLVLAGISSALMLRNAVQDHALSMN